MKRCLLFGGNGYIGSKFCQFYPSIVKANVDICDRELVRNIINAEKPDVIINCAGKCGIPNIDWCETHKIETIHSNVTGPLVLLEECLKFQNIQLVHLSSGCIYAGNNSGNGFTENDHPNYIQSYYSKSKAVVEDLLKDYPVLILRIRMPFDGSVNARNLFMKLRNYTKLITTENSMTCLDDFVQVANQLIDKRAIGIYNVVNSGAISPYEIMNRYKAIIDSKASFAPIDESQLSKIVKSGRSNCKLSIHKIEDLGIKMRNVSDAVDESLLKLKYQLENVA